MRRVEVMGWGKMYQGAFQLGGQLGWLEGARDNNPNSNDNSAGLPRYSCSFRGERGLRVAARKSFLAPRSDVEGGR